MHELHELGVLTESTQPIFSIYQTAHSYQFV